MLKQVIYAVAISSAGCTASTAAIAADEYNISSGLTAASAPLALHGVDTVAFIQTGNRIQGVARYTAAHDGVAYHFATQENLDAFNANPEGTIAKAQAQWRNIRSTAATDL